MTSNRSDRSRQPDAFTFARRRRGIRRLVDCAGLIDANGRSMHRGIEALERRLLLAIIDPAGSAIGNHPLATLGVGGQDEVIVDINPGAAGQKNDVIAVTGNASLSGQLTLRLANGVSLTSGQTFEILTSGNNGITGAFTAIKGVDAAGSTFDFVAVQTGGSLKVVATTLPGVSMTIIPMGSPGEQTTRAADLIGLFAGGSGDGLDDTLTVPATVSAYGQRFAGQLTLTEGTTAGLPSYTMAFADGGGQFARYSVGANVTDTASTPVTIFGASAFTVRSNSGGVATASLATFTGSGFAIGDASAATAFTISNGKFGPLSFNGFTVDVPSVDWTADGFEAEVSIGASSATLALGGTSAVNANDRFKIEVTGLNIGIGVEFDTSSGAIDEGATSGKVAIEADDITVEVRDVITVKASGGIAINPWDDSQDSSQVLVEIGNASVEVPRLKIKGTFTSSDPDASGLVIRGNGFDFGTLAVILDTTTSGATTDAQGFLSIGNRLKLKNPGLRLNDFSMSFDAAGAVTETSFGGFGFQADEVQLNAFAGFTAVATGVELDLAFPVSITPTQTSVAAAPTGVRFKVTTIDIQLGFVKISGVDIELNTAAEDDEYFLTVAGSIGAQLDMGSFFGSFGGSGPSFAIGGSAGGFAIKGDGSFEAFTTSSPAPYDTTPFFVTLNVDASKVQDVLADVANLPDSLPTTPGASGSLEMRISWPDFNADKTRFLMRLTGEIEGDIGGATGLHVRVAVNDLQIDSAKIESGEFPIVGLQSFSGSVSGTIMGSAFNGAIVLGLVRFDDQGGVLDPLASPDDIFTTRLYVGARGGVTLPNGWGVQAQFAFSEAGFLNFYISANVSIPLGPTGLEISGLRGGVTFNATPLPDIEDPVDLRNPLFKSPEDLTNEEWEETVRQLVINQYGGTPGFLFEIEQASGQNWTTLFNGESDPGLYLPEAVRTAFLNAGISIPRRSGVSEMTTLEAGNSWLLTVGSDAFIIERNSGNNTFSFSQITLVMPAEFGDQLPSSGTATAGSIAIEIDGTPTTLVQFFAKTGRVITAGAIVESTGADEWTITDGGVKYTLALTGGSSAEIIAVTGGDPSFESGSGTYVRLDVGFTLSSIGSASAWRLKADAIVQFVVGGDADTKIVLLGELSVGPQSAPTFSMDARLLIDMTDLSDVKILMLADFIAQPPAPTDSDTNPEQPVPFLSFYGRVNFVVAGGTLTISIAGSQTRGLAEFNPAGLLGSSLPAQRLLLGAPSSPSAMDGAGSAMLSFGNGQARFRFEANLSAQGLINASSIVSAAGDFTVNYATVSIGGLSIPFPTALWGAARLNASLDQISILNAAGIEGNINLMLKINTTNAERSVLLRRPASTLEDEIRIAPLSFALFGDGNLSFKPPVAGSLFRMQITGAFGIDISAGGGANLFIVGTMPVPIPAAALAGMTADVVGLVRIDGSNFAARLELGIQNDPSQLKFFSIGAALQLYINTAGAEVQYTMPRDIAARLATTLPATLANRLVWSGAGDASIVVPERAPLISYSTDGALSPVSGGYLVIQGFGYVDILDPISKTQFLRVDASARLALQVDASNASDIKTQFMFELAGNANLGGIVELSINAGIIISTTFDVSQPLPRITSVNMAGLLSLSASAGVAGLIKLSGSGAVKINTFSTPQPIAGDTLPANSVSITITGDLLVGPVFKLSGTFTFENNAQRILIAGSVELDLYIAKVQVDLAAALYKSIVVGGVETNNPGLVLNVGISLDVDFLKVFHISGSGRLKLSTRAVETTITSAPAGQQNVPARINASTPYVNITIGASLNFLELVTVTGSLSFSTINDTEWQSGWSPSVKRHWKIEGALTAAAGISFLGGAEARIGNARMLNGNLSGRNAVFYDTGEFDVDASLRIQVGPDEFNVNGRGYAFASYLRNASGVKTLSFGGGAALGISVDVDLGEVDVGLFTIDLGSITFTFDAVSVDFRYNGNTGEVTIRPEVMGIGKTFSLGFFRLPAGATQRPIVINLAGPEFYTARSASDGPAGVYDETTAWSGGQLWINAGTRAQYRNLSNDEINEDFIIEADGPYNTVTGRQNLKITAFGQTQLRSDVSSIRALMGTGMDNVVVRAGVLVPVTIDGGEGNDKITYSSTGLVTITGGAGNDRITAGGATGSSIDGGDNDDVITWLAGNGAAVSVSGGLGNDQFIAAFSDQADRIRLNRTAPEQFRLSKLAANDSVIEFVSVTGGIESLRVNTLRGADELIVDDFDAAGMTIYFDVSRYQSGTTPTTAPGGGVGQAPVYANDADADKITISGRSAADIFLLTSPADTGNADADSDTAEGVLNVNRTVAGSSVYQLRILNLVPNTGETVKINGLGGDDTLDASGVDKNMARLTLVGNAGNDTIKGSAFADTLVGDEEDGSGTGNDTINGGAGDDDIKAGNGNNVITGDAGNDTIEAGSGDDDIDGGIGNDTIKAGNGNNVIKGGDDDDNIESGDGADDIEGGNGNDTIKSGAGNDTIDGGAGNDDIDSGLGDDTVTGGLGQDTYTDAGGTDTFIETRNRDMFISDDTFVVGVIDPGTLGSFADAFSGVDENENLKGIFNVVRITGGAAVNTIVVGDVNGSISVPGNANQAVARQFTGHAILNGLAAGDRYIITVFGVSGSLFDVVDSGTTGSDLLRIYGSDIATRTDTFLVRKNFVAALFDADNNGSLEVFDRINYDTRIETPLAIFGLKGDDKFIVDETSIATNIDGGEGADFFQFGQIFADDRVPTAVALGDEIATTPIVLGTPGGGTVVARLTAGPSTAFTALGGDGDDAFVVFHTISPLTLQGQAGNDVFTVRAFEQVAGTGGTTQGNTTVAGGAGADIVEFVSNAPITIEGGEGIDTVRLLGTFRADQFIVDATGITGPGITISYSTIETLEINSGDGDDEIFVRSTAENLRVIVFGGAGSDRMYVGKSVPGQTATPQSLALIRGPVLLDGGPGAPGVFGLSVAVKLPSETDGTLPPGAGNMSDSELTGDVDTVDIVSTDDTADLFGLMSARVWPAGSTSYNVITLSGLGMGGDLVQGTPPNQETVPGGISLRRLEVVDAQLGSGVETITIEAVLPSAITIFRGNGGSDVFNVTAPATTDAMLVIYGDALPGETFTGVSGNDRVNGRTAGVDMTVDGGAGNDVIITGSGADRIAGGSGNDVIAAGAGNDLIIGDSRFSVDRLSRLTTIISQGLADSDQAGSDVINPGAGFNIAFGDHGTVRTGPSAGSFLPGEVFIGASTVRPTIGAADTISAFAAAHAEFAGLDAEADGSDLVFGGAGADTIRTGAGRDWAIGDHASTAIVPATATQSRPVTATPDGQDILNPDDAVAGPTDNVSAWGNLRGIDVIAGTSLVNSADQVKNVAGPSKPRSISHLRSLLITGGVDGIFINSGDPTEGAADDIDTGDGDDVIVGGTGGDTLKGGAGNDLIMGDHAQIDPFSSSLETRFISTFSTSAAAGGNDLIQAGEGDDVALGQQGVDTMFGDAGDDDLIGGHNVVGGLDGVDYIDAGAGDDVAIGDNGVIIRPVGYRSPRFVMPGNDGAMYDGAMNASVIGNVQTGPGAAAPRQITILDAAPTTPTSSFGNDLIAGGAGRDMLFGGNGNDTIRGDSRLSGPVNPSLLGSADPSTDGDDYIEGNAGADTLYGDLGQDDIVGGSSSLFGLGSDSRADGSDTIFGGAGTLTGRNHAGDTSATGAARDADVIAGDNADIMRLVTPSGVAMTFNYDQGAALRIAPRVVNPIDYTTDGVAAGDTGNADLIHGESGNDVIYGQTGNDTLYGDGNDDDIIGGSGNDWIYGGAGSDAVLGDDGRLLTSRNGAAEPLYAISATNAAYAGVATTPDAWISVPIFTTGTIQRTARFQSFASGGNDVIYGGTGDDFLHGGAGNDAISGAEALPEFFTPPATRPTLVYDANLRRFLAYQPGFAMQKIANFFLNFDAGPIGSPIDDGKDALFGDNGHDWLVGGTNADYMFGGMGDDVMNGDDQQSTGVGNNNGIPDVGPDASPDIMFGGGGLDRMLSNASNDRMIDWNGEFNQYVTPYVQTYPTVVKVHNTFIINALRSLGAGLGMDARLAEPLGELGIVTDRDSQWLDQFTRPNF